MLVGFILPAWADSIYECSFNELMVCGEGIGCSDESKGGIDIPRQIQIDVARGTLTGLDDAGNLREATAESIEHRDGVYFFQAIQRTRPEGSNVVGWTVFLESKAMKISGSVVNMDLVFSVFGDCSIKGE